jgi:hypothetical protein
MKDTLTVVDELQRVCRLVTQESPSATVREALAAVSKAEAVADLPYLRENVPQAPDRCVDGLKRVSSIVRSIREFANGSGTQWMGRGVNIDDIFFCGYDDSLWMSGPDTALEQVLSALMTGWKPSFVRISLAMDSYGTPVSWLSDPSQYKTPMVNVINALAGYPTAPRTAFDSAGWSMCRTC